MSHRRNAGHRPGRARERGPGTRSSPRRDRSPVSQRLEAGHDRVCFAPAAPGKVPCGPPAPRLGGPGAGDGLDVFREIASTLASRGLRRDHPPLLREDRTTSSAGPIREGEYEAWLDAVKRRDRVRRQPEAGGRPGRFAMIGYSMGSGWRCPGHPRPEDQGGLLGLGRLPADQAEQEAPAAPDPPRVEGQEGRRSITSRSMWRPWRSRRCPTPSTSTTAWGTTSTSARFGDATRRSVAFFNKYVKTPETMTRPAFPEKSALRRLAPRRPRSPRPIRRAHP